MNMSGIVPIGNNENKKLIDRIDQVEGLVIKMNGKLEKIYDVVVGNETFDQEGVLSRIKKLENESSKIHAIKNKLIGAFIAGGAVWTVLWELFKNFIKG